VTAIPDIRIRPCNDQPPREDGDFVLYWMTAFRRLGWNFALERAVEAARELGKPLVILEPLRCGYRWASDRIHRFVIDGMADHAARLKGSQAEKFLDEAITWREVGYNMASHREDFERYESLPDWARATLAKHEKDTRPHLYSPEELDAGATRDALWNAAQGQLREEGRIHNYLRMLWGKKTIEWSPTPRAALGVLIDLNNRYALDGRDPNSYSGIFWCFGRYDRPWAPERPVFGTVRYMSSESARSKFKVDAYVARYGQNTGQLKLV
jgi:deoxyribodipyrimidine photolyase